MPAVIEARVCELRRQHPYWGPVRIRHQLGRDGVEPVPSPMGIWRALVRHGLIEPNARRKRPVDYKRWERGRPMELWQLDVVGGVGVRASSLRLHSLQLRVTTAVSGKRVKPTKTRIERDVALDEDTAAMLARVLERRREVAASSLSPPPHDATLSSSSAQAAPSRTTERSASV